jgi:hypothetical protein
MLGRLFVGEGSPADARGSKVLWAFQPVPEAYQFFTKRHQQVRQLYTWAGLVGEVIAPYLTLYILPVEINDTYL